MFKKDELIYLKVKSHMFKRYEVLCVKSFKTYV